jgi:hypothetical protein
VPRRERADYLEQGAAGECAGDAVDVGEMAAGSRPQNGLVMKRSSVRFRQAAPGPDINVIRSGRRGDQHG